MASRMLSSSNFAQLTLCPLHARGVKKNTRSHHYAHHAHPAHHAPASAASVPQCCVNSFTGQHVQGTCTTKNMLKADIFWSGDNGPLPFPVLSARFQCLLEAFSVRWHLLLSWSVQVESIPVHRCPLLSAKTC